MNLCLLHHQSIVVRCQVSNFGILRFKLNFRSAIPGHGVTANRRGFILFDYSLSNSCSDWHWPCPLIWTWKFSTIQMITFFIVLYTGFLSQAAAEMVAPVDDVIKKKIHRLVMDQGVYTLPSMRTHLRDYVKTNYPEVSELNTRFHPDDRTIANHIQLALSETMFVTHTCIRTYTYWYIKVAHLCTLTVVQHNSLSCCSKHNSVWFNFIHIHTYITYNTYT